MEPSLGPVVSGDQLDRALAAIGEFAELKSPWTLGHAAGVAQLATTAGRDYGLPNQDLVMLRRAAMVHDIGRLGVSNTIWDKRGRLSRAELERVRLHPYLSERMLAFSPALAPVGALAALHHERLDGSGYPRGVAGEAITPAGRVLAAADAYHAMVEMRPYRAALSSEAAATRLLARGLSNREIAAHLVVAPKTVGNHVEHIYAKLGVSNRAMASLYAVKHGLMTGSVEPLPEHEGNAS